MGLFLKGKLYCCGVVVRILLYWFSFWFGGVCRVVIKKLGFVCKNCKRGFFNRVDYIDFMILEGIKVYDENKMVGEEIFRCVIWIYRNVLIGVVIY